MMLNALKTVKRMRPLVASLLLSYLSLVDCNKDNKIYQDVPDAFYKDCLVEMNKYRRLHNAYPLRWNTDLQYHAQLWADHIAREGMVENDVEGLDKLGQGETVSYLSPPKPQCRSYPPADDCYACRTTIAAWYNESKDYDYKTGFSLDGTKQVLHFTQLVWKDTVKVGMATAISKYHGVITVARFHPRGNVGFVDDYIRNVAPRDDSVKNGEIDFKSNEGEKEEGGQEGPSCHHLKRRRKKKGCVNEYGDEMCDFYVQRFPGYCDYNRLFMMLHCAKSCNLCKGRLPSPAAEETEEERKLNLGWEVDNWHECHGGLQWRPVRCHHKYHNRTYHVKNRYCVHQLGPRPSQYRDCPIDG